MVLIDRLEHATGLDPLVQAGQRAARLVRPGRIRDVLHGTWLGHPLHPLLAQAATGAWLSAGVLDCSSGQEKAARLLTAVGLAAAGPAALAGAADWSEQHEQQMRVGVVHAMANALAIGLYGASLAVRGPGWHYLMKSAELPEGKPVRQQVGEAPVVVVRARGEVYVLADRCSHMSGSLSDGDLDGGCLTCPWHGSMFRIEDGSVARGPATAPQPAFQVREVGGALQIMLPGAG